MNFNKNLLTATLLALGGLTAISNANAVTTDTFDITLTVNSACDITAGSAADIDLGTADNTVKTGTNAIEVFCSVGTPYQLALVPGNDDAAGLGALSGPGDDVAYQLTKTDGGAVWGSTEDTNTLESVGAGAYSAQSHGVTVTTTSSTDVEPGIYTDTVTINLIL